MINRYKVEDLVCMMRVNVRKQKHLFTLIRRTHTAKELFKIS